MRSTSLLGEITPVILTYDEAPNIRRVLDKLGWASEVVVVDSGSNDGTLDILAGYPNVRVIYRAFDTHAEQWNFAISNTGIRTDWVLALDADYVLSDAIISEVESLDPGSADVGYETRFRYCVFGRPLRGALYPPVVTLFRRSKGRFEQEGHTQRVKISGKVGRLEGFIFHDDRKTLLRWLASQEKYAELEANYLMSKSIGDLRVQDRLRRMIIVTPWLVPLYCLTVKRGALDGLAGFYYALQRGIAEAILALKIIEAKWRTNSR